MRLSLWDSAWSGIISVAMLGYVFSFFFGVGGGIFGFFLIAIALLLLSFRFRMLFAEIKSMQSFVLPASIWTLLVAAHAALPSNYIDDGVYYAQSVRWFETYGLIKGLGNLDPNLAQGSLLHLLSAITNLSFLGFRFNDFAAFTLWLIGMEVLYIRPNLKTGLFVVLAFTLLFSLWMISAENTDVFLIVIFIKIFLLLKRHASSISKPLLLGLIALAIGTKASALPLVLLLLTPYFRPWHLSIRISLFVLIPLFILFFKSWFITGYPLFPFHPWQPFEVAWALPNQYFHFSQIVSFFSAYVLNPSGFSDVNNVTGLNRLQILFSPTHWKGVFHIVYGVVLCASFLLFRQTQGSYRLLVPIYAFTIIYIASSPQPRIALPYLILLVCLLANHYHGVFFTFKMIKSFRAKFNHRTIIAFPTLFVFSMLFLPWSFAESWFRGNGITSYRTLKTAYLVKPHPTWQSIAVVKKEINGISFYQPLEKNGFCYDAAFPCLVMPVQDYLDETYYFAPVPLGSSIRSGFGYEAWEIDRIHLEEWNSFSHRLRRLWR